MWLKLLRLIISVFKDLKSHRDKYFKPMSSNSVSAKSSVDKFLKSQDGRNSIHSPTLLPQPPKKEIIMI